MLRISSYLAGLAVVLPAFADPKTWDAPSGQQFSLYEVIEEPQDNGLLLRTRFVFEGEAIAFDPWVEAEPEQDMAHLCEFYTLNMVQETKVDMIIVSVAAEPTDFGVATPSIPQVFEAYSVQDTTCQWEPF